MVAGNDYVAGAGTATDERENKSKKKKILKKCDEEEGVFFTCLIALRESDSRSMGAPERLLG